MGKGEASELDLAPTLHLCCCAFVSTSNNNTHHSLIPSLLTSPPVYNSHIRTTLFSCLILTHYIRLEEPGQGGRAREDRDSLALGLKDDGILHYTTLHCTAIRGLTFFIHTYNCRSVCELCFYPLYTSLLYVLTMARAHHILDGQWRERRRLGTLSFFYCTYSDQA